MDISEEIERRFDRDECAAVIGDRLSQTVSHDYTEAGAAAAQPVRAERKVTLPSEIVDQYDVGGGAWRTGVFPSIQRAYVVIGSRLMLWNWASAEADVVSFDEMDDDIVGVGLVRPKPGVFVRDVEHVLVLCTRTTVQLIGLSMRDGTATFFITDLVVATNGTEMTCVHGTHDGRIFLTTAHEPKRRHPGVGGDGGLYEFEYRSTEGWFSRKCSLVRIQDGKNKHNSSAGMVLPAFLKGLVYGGASEWVDRIAIDEERGLLYALLRSGSIDIYSFGPRRRLAERLHSIYSPSTYNVRRRDTSSWTSRGSWDWLSAVSADWFHPAVPNVPLALGDAAAARPPTPSNTSGALQYLETVKEPLKDAFVMSTGHPALASTAIVSLDVIPIRDRGVFDAGLVATTATGARLYFSHGDRHIYMSMWANPFHKSILSLCHVRLPFVATLPAPASAGGATPTRQRSTVGVNGLGSAPSNLAMSSVQPSNMASVQPSNMANAHLSNMSNIPPSLPPLPVMQEPVLLRTHATFASPNIFFAVGQNAAHPDDTSLIALSPHTAVEPDDIARARAYLRTRGPIAISRTSPSASPSASPSFAAASAAATTATAAASTQARLPPFTESAVRSDIPGFVFDVADVTEIRPGFHVPYDALGHASGNDLVSQFLCPPRQFAFISSVGVSLYAAQRPIDVLFCILHAYAQNAPGAVSDLQALYSVYGGDNTCAMLLAIASNGVALDLQGHLAPPAKEHASSFFSPPDAAFHPPITMQLIVDQARALYFDPFSSMEHFAGSPLLVMSSRVEGYALYLSRLLRPLWGELVFKSGTGVFKSGGGAKGAAPLVSNVPLPVIAAVHSRLRDLVAFTNAQRHALNLNAPASSAADPASTTSHAAASSSSHALLQPLAELAARAHELTAFVIVLSQLGLDDVFAHSAPSTQALFATMSYKSLFTTHQAQLWVRALMSSLIDLYIASRKSVDQLTTLLHDRCGAMCSANDALRFKAQEALKTAAEAQSPTSKAAAIDTSLHYLLQTAHSMSLDTLRVMVDLYQELASYDSVLVICMAYVQKMSPQDSADVAAYHQDLLSGIPVPETGRVASLYDTRIAAYGLILRALDTCDAKLAAAVAAAGSQSSPASSTVEHGPVVPPQSLASFEANALAAERDALHRKLFAYDDPLLHFTVYDWYLSTYEPEFLIAIDAPASREAYLRSEPFTLVKADLLWQLLVKQNRHGEASLVLTSLAESGFPQLSLTDRLRYLTLALGNARLDDSSTAAVDVLTSIEDRLDIAQVQVELYSVLSNDALALTISEDFEDDPDVPRTLDDIRTFLSSRLLSISDLYNAIVLPYNLPEYKLVIFKIADHESHDDIVEAWRDALLSDAEPAVRLTALTRRFYPSSVFYLLDILKILLTEAGPSLEWIPDSLHAGGVDWLPVFSAYADIMSSSVSLVSDAARVALSASIAHILSAWIGDGSYLPSAQVLPVVATCLGYLSSRSDAHARDVAIRLEGIERSLKQ